MKILIMGILVVVLFYPLFTERLTVLGEISKPSFDIIIDQDQLFITEGPKVFVYSLSDYKLKHSFGRRGEGPGEFKLGPDEEVYLVPAGDRLVIESSGRISFFSRSGNFIKETKIPFRSTYTLLQPLGQGFIGFKDEMDEQTRVYYKMLCIFDSQLNKQKEICRVKHVFQQKGLTLLRGTFLFKVANNRIFVTYWGGDFIMDCFNQDGEKLFTIRDENFQKRKVSTNDISRIHTYFKTYHEAWFARNREHLHIKEYWPAIGTFFLDKDRIYIVTYIPQHEETTEKWLVYVYNQQGTFIKKVFLPLKEQDIWSTYPHTFYQNRLFQLLENEETEEWELHVTAID